MSVNNPLGRLNTEKTVPSCMTHRATCNSALHRKEWARPSSIPKISLVTLFVCKNKAVEYFLHNRRPYIEGILPKGPYLPCVSMAGRALLAGYHRYKYICRSNFVTCPLLVKRYSYFSKYLAQWFCQFSNRCCCFPVIVIHCIERFSWTHNNVIQTGIRNIHGNITYVVGSNTLRNDMYKAKPIMLFKGQTALL